MKTLKKIFVIFSLLLITGFAVAQSPQAFNYQAVARNAAGNVLPDQALGIRVSIHQGSEAGDVVYSETFATSTNEFGLFNLSIGTGTVASGNFSTIDWGDHQYWMQVEVDMNGGTTYTDMGTSQLLSVPYAMYASKSVWEKNGASAVYMDGGVGIGTLTPTATLDVVRNNTMTNSQIWVKQLGTGDASIGFNTPSGSWGIANDQDDFGKLKIGNNAFASSSPQMTFDQNGHIGMGTTNPSTQSKLNVASHNRYAGYFTTDSVSSFTQAVHGEYTGTNYVDAIGVFGQSHPIDNYGIGGYFVGGYRGVYGSSIGTGAAYYYGVRGIAESTGAGHTYGVYGSATTVGGTAYGVYCSGNGAYTGTWTDVSDAKFKSNVADYNENALLKIMLLRPVSYTMKTAEYPFMGFEPGTQVGFIAQEVKIIFPNLVENGAHPGESKDDPAIEYEGLNYIGMIPILVKGMQEQQAEIELLKDEIKLLKNK
ncbi:MAG: hypothetical protein A2W93_00250 [Bacteroidetes bacterium GWF2_43_63]|nr:MAG: hypothetical protein A2W94_13270 [Bacteroidetes bacterium GWE2_42_42]OFY53837.1 MAG: hypothetical protein A2W93_00250 [Bacteroidetes bacterium GWF2_43_63]HBG69793.1 hypothetical protein [Bacteroidales bacterium]HCB61009.1 hypothetical protein [Bacteroidales bacterium]HCY24565.1 hypothetical protein [Bacteroidales bacterium]